jgi:hypothetical protein
LLSRFVPFCLPPRSVPFVNKLSRNCDQQIQKRVFKVQQTATRQVNVFAFFRCNDSTIHGSTFATAEMLNLLNKSKISLRHDSFRKESLIMKISLRLFGCALGFAALAVTGALAQDEPAAFSIQFVSQFDYPGTGNQTRPQKINSMGDIAGLFVDTSGASFGFVRLSNGHFSPAIADPNATSNFTEGRGINDSRLVCGDYLDSAGAFEGFFFQNNTFTNYVVPNSTTTIVLGVNNVGDFCGSNIPSSTGIQGAFLSIGGTVTEFTIPNATATLAYQLNRTNQSCGYYIDSSGVTHGFWRDTNGTIHAPIDPMGSTGTILFGNNDRNLMVGRFSDSAGATHGILFVPPNRFLVYDFPGATFTSLNGINRNNTIVGRYTDPNTGIDHGLILQVVRTAAGGVTLPLAPPSAPPAQAVPQQGVIVAPAY